MNYFSSIEALAPLINSLSWCKKARQTCTELHIARHLCAADSCRTLGCLLWLCPPSHNSGSTGSAGSSCGLLLQPPNARQQRICAQRRRPRPGVPAQRSGAAAGGAARRGGWRRGGCRGRRRRRQRRRAARDRHRAACGDRAVLPGGAPDTGEIYQDCYVSNLKTEPSYLAVRLR